MKHFSIIGILCIIWLTGCVFVKPNDATLPTQTKEVHLIETSIPTIHSSPTLTNTPSPMATEEVAPTAVIFVTATVSSDDFSANSQAVSEEPQYTIQAGSPRWLPNFSHPDVGCNFLGIAGQVFGLDGLPDKMLVVEAGGSLEGMDYFALSLTGIESIYGPGGFEILLSDHVIASNDSVWIQVYNLEGQPRSDKVFFDTFSDCQKNLVLINFVEGGLAEIDNWLYLPVIFRNVEHPN